jgi:hypothetical protein
MTNLIKYALLAAADLVLIGFATTYVVQCLMGHRPFMSYDSVYGFAKFKRNLHVGVVFLGIGLILYGGFLFLLSWMPHQWVSYDDEGDDPIWMATVIAVFLAFFGSLWLIPKFEEVADTISKSKNQRQS